MLKIDFFFSKIGKSRTWSFDKGENSLTHSSEIALRSDMDKVKIEDLILYTFEMLASATDNFDLSKKLGMGGFGPVYKVSSFVLPNIHAKFASHVS